MMDNPFVDDSAKKRILKMISSGYQGKFFIPPMKYRKYKDVNEAVIKENDPNIFSSLE
jgi:hypothetical protein